MTKPKAGVEVTFTGASGAVNYDVGVENGGNARLENGQTVIVSEELAARLLSTAYWTTRRADGEKGATA